MHVQFSLRPDTIRDLKGLKYHLYEDTKCPTHGVTPFSLIKIATSTLREISHEEEAADQASHLTVQDIMRCNRQLLQPITEPLTFLKILATFQTLTHILFGDCSPLFLNADQMYRLAVDGYNGQMLMAVRAAHPHWFAHILWATTLATHKYLQRSLSLDQLKCGLQLPWPFEHIIPALRMFSDVDQPNTPPVLLPLPPNHSGHKWKGQGTDSPHDSPPKQARHQDTKNNYLPKPLFDLKQTIPQHLTRISLAHVLKEGGTDIQTLMWTTGVPHQTCCHYIFWGVCADNSTMTPSSSPLSKWKRPWPFFNQESPNYRQLNPNQHESIRHVYYQATPALLHHYPQGCPWSH